MSFIVIGVGALFQLIFHIGTDEKNLLNDDQIAEAEHNFSYSTHTKLDWLGYLKNFRFYTMAVVYMFTRLIVNMTQVYLPMFLTDTLKLNKVMEYFL